MNSTDNLKNWFQQMISTADYRYCVFSLGGYTSLECYWGYISFGLQAHLCVCAVSVLRIHSCTCEWPPKPWAGHWPQFLSWSWAMFLSHEHDPSDSRFRHGSWGMVPEPSDMHQDSSSMHYGIGWYGQMMHDIACCCWGWKRYRFLCDLR